MYHIGQQVVCIDDAQPSDPSEQPYKDCVYTISEIFKASCDCGCVMFQFEEYRWEGNELFFPGLCSESFRPVKKTSIEIFQKLLAPTPELVS